MNFVSSPSLLTISFGLFLILLKSSACHGVCSTCSNENNSNGLLLKLNEVMKRTTNGILYDLGGLFYNRKGNLTISLARKSSTKMPPPKRGDTFEGINATAFKEIILDIYGPSVLLSQVKAKRAEKIMHQAEKNANKKAKKKGERPPTSAMIDADIRRKILSDQKLLSDISLAFVPATFGFEELYDDYQRLVSKIFEFDDVLLSDLNEENNQIYVAVLTDEGLDNVQQIAKRLEIDPMKIFVEKQRKGEWFLDDGESLEDRVRPILGGLFIEVPTDSSVSQEKQRGCSIGFVARRNQTGEVGFVTVSYCTAVEAEVDPDPMKAYQVERFSIPPLPSTDVDVIGVETSDTIESDGTICSDSAFFTFTNDVEYSTGIYKTEENGSNHLKTKGRKSWYSLRIDHGSLRNEIVYKVGRNTGQTRGKVKRTCVFAARFPFGYNRHCQDIVNNYDEDIRFQGKGDSGTATIYTLSANSRFAWIRGITWGRKSNPDNCENLEDCTGLDPEDKPPEVWDNFVNPIENVECDHGKLYVHYNDVP